MCFLYQWVCGPSSFKWIYDLIHPSIHPSIHTYIQTYMYIYIYTCILIYIYTYLFKRKRHGCLMPYLFLPLSNEHLQLEKLCTFTQTLLGTREECVVQLSLGAAGNILVAGSTFLAMTNFVCYSLMSSLGLLHFSNAWGLPWTFTMVEVCRLSRPSQLGGPPRNFKLFVW